MVDVLIENKEAKDKVIDGLFLFYIELFVFIAVFKIGVYNLVDEIDLFEVVLYFLYDVILGLQ